jgi:D-sedoheptulose 7-phosphate isomerase
MQKSITNIINQSAENFNNISNDPNIISGIHKIVNLIVDAFQNDNKLLLCGNGGSAADAQHIAAELSGRFMKDRKPLYAEALHVNSSYVLLALSTSGNSANVIQALKKANELGMKTIGFSGKHGGKMNGLCNTLLKIPSSSAARIQEAHILIGHIICELVEETIFE